MTVDVFLDSNVVIYAASRLDSEASKKAIAMELMTTTNLGTSAQVLQEFYTVSTRKIAKPLSHLEAIGWIEAFEDLPCVSTDLTLVYLGAENARRHKISYWDGAIIAAAERLGASILYSEDLSDGQTYGTIKVVNPFKNN